MYPKTPQIIYHGSLNPNLKHGDILRPGEESREEEYSGRASHSTTDYATASLYAGGPHLLGPGIRGGIVKNTRGAVYHVEPVDELEMHESTSKLKTSIPGHVASEKGFRVVGVASRPEDASEYPKLIEPDNS
jgi:hypothetical protein